MDDDWVIKRIERARYARSLELIAFSKTVSALRAGHRYTKKVAKSIKTIADILKIPDNYRRTEIRRAANDNFLSATAACILQENTDEGWLKAGVKCIPNQPIISANTTHTKLADYISDILKNLNNTDYREESKGLKKCEDKNDEAHSDVAETSSVVIPKKRFEIIPDDDSAGAVRNAPVPENGSGIVSESSLETADSRTIGTFAEEKEVVALRSLANSKMGLEAVRHSESESNSTIACDSGSTENVLQISGMSSRDDDISEQLTTTERASTTVINANIIIGQPVRGNHCSETVSADGTLALNADQDSDVTARTRSIVTAEEAGAKVTTSVSANEATSEEIPSKTKSYLGICSEIGTVPKTRLQIISEHRLQSVPEFVSKAVSSAVSSSSESSISSSSSLAKDDGPVEKTDNDEEVGKHYVNEHAYCSETASTTAPGKLTERDSAAGRSHVISEYDRRSRAKLNCSPCQLDLVKNWPAVSTNSFCKQAQSKSPASNESSAVDKLLLLVAAADLVAELTTVEEEQNQQSEATEKKISTVPADADEFPVENPVVDSASSANDRNNDDSRCKEKLSGQPDCSKSGAVAETGESNYSTRRDSVRRTIRKRNMPDFVSTVSRKKKKSENVSQSKRRQDDSAADSSATDKNARTSADDPPVVKPAKNAKNSSRKLSKESSVELSKLSSRRTNKRKALPEPSIIDFDELMNESPQQQQQQSSSTNAKNVSEPQPPASSNAFAVKRTRRKALPEVYDTGQTTVAACGNSTAALDDDFNIVIIDDDENCIGNESATVITKPESPSILITSESSSSSLMSPEHSFNLIPTSRRQANPAGKGKRCSDTKGK